MVIYGIFINEPSQGKKTGGTSMKYNKSVYQSLTLITQFGINMLVPIFICTFIGIFIDKKLNTNFVVIILFFLGAAAGFRNIYIMAKSIFDKGKDDNSHGTGK